MKEALKEGVNISADGIERVLQRKMHILENNIVELICKNAALHTENIIDSCITTGVKFSEAPVVYTGGGCLLLKEYLQKNKHVKMFEIIQDVKANAVYYAKSIRD